ncbi:MAG: hypothetical protein A3I68_03100 [Candidatus Melainabacteria bacterium RIFCSPLOWO2_02_FULL_35_15]|nr:MAG: hypothetical protein A3F80_04750 [Candidatus Melainabacteria bacterium RIFCSPLOWO2_12_FULL_35_11]OGI13306.1 MAG: hypothetical protein A3I68_03100 [Candidatus Melainabacteria bacterium RIFCSPLOWO2_02_FULL_35_15]
MGYIKQLSEDLIKKIAAGEVIERPASVVKELIENSIDAGATKIEAEIDRGGKYIKVSDNGMGIEPGDIDLLFARHATSKIKSFDDLWTIDSLGFRGEALASVNAVSKVTCRSKHIDQEYGFEIKEIDGKINKKSFAVSIGTVFEIDELFYNVPARQKFLKSETTEYGHIYDVAVSLALSHPKISVTLRTNKNITLKSSGSNDLKQTMSELLGSDLQNRLIPLSGKNDFLTFEGFASALEVFRSDRKFIFIFINKRPVKCQIISKAIFSAFEGLLPPGKFPVIVLNLKFKPKLVDVNVHPAKKEVRYTQPNDVYNLILHSIQDAVSKYYKERYKEKSVYALPVEKGTGGEDSRRVDEPERQKDEDMERVHCAVQPPDSSYTKAAFELYAPLEDTVKPLSGLFSVSNLKCQITYSDKPIANMAKIGNKTIFEVGSIFDDNLQVIFNGEIVGESRYQKDFFNYLSDLSSLIFKTYLNNETVLQKKIISNDLESKEIKENNRKKPPDSLLYKIWERDNWTCVYCGKQLLAPEVVKKSVSKAKDAFITYINNEGQKITNHILREHIASYDHYLPSSKVPQFNFEDENLFACCIDCNRKKLDSMELETWKPQRKNAWSKPLEIAGISFKIPNS